MTKEKFVKYLEELEKLQAIEMSITNAFRELDDNFNMISFSRYENLLVRLLEECVGDVNDTYGSWTSWWIYETNFGKDKKMAKSHTVHGKRFPLKNAGDLYGLITTK